MFTRVALNFDYFLRIFIWMPDSLPKIFVGWFSHESHNFESYYYATIQDNINATALGLSTMVVSQKAPMVEHCEPSYACEQVDRCVFAPVSCNTARHLSSEQYRKIFTAPEEGHFHDVVTFGKCTNLDGFCVSRFRAHTIQWWFY